MQLPRNIWKYIVIWWIKCFYKMWLALQMNWMIVSLSSICSAMLNFEEFTYRVSYDGSSLLSQFFSIYMLLSNRHCWSIVSLNNQSYDIFSVLVNKKKNDVKEYLWSCEKIGIRQGLSPSILDLCVALKCLRTTSLMLF